MTTTTDLERPDTKAATPPASRHVKLAKFLLKYGGRGLIDKLRIHKYLTREDAEARDEARAEELVKDLEVLGPTYVKFGQLLSTRSDLLPPQFLEQLERLQDQVEPMPFETVKQIVETELGRPLREVFSSFEEAPIGSASLGQVHAALLADGREVAVKVQRPGVKEVITADIEALRDFAGWFEKRTETGRRYAVTALVEEFNSAIMREIDYELEADNMGRLKRNLLEFPQVVVPDPVLDLTTTRVLTMEFVTGQKVSKIGPLIRNNMDGAALADVLLKAYLKQVFVDGFFHADPHPGNVFVIDSDHVALLDVGLVGVFTSTLRRKLLQILPAIYEGDVNEMVEICLEIGETEENLDRAELKTRFGSIVQVSQTGSIEKIRVSRVLMDVVRAAAECGVRLPPEISTLGRTLLHLDRVGRYLAPAMDVNGAVRRHIGEIMQRQLLRDSRPRALFRSMLEASELIRQLPRRVNRVLDSLLERKLGFRVDVVPEVHLLENLEKIANRITLGLILAALIVGASQLMQVDTKFKLWGYPGFAMICYAGALVGSLILVVGIIRADRKTRHEAPAPRG